MYVYDDQKARRVYGVVWCGVAWRGVLLLSWAWGGVGGAAASSFAAGAIASTMQSARTGYASW